MSWFPAANKLRIRSEGGKRSRRCWSEIARQLHSFVPSLAVDASDEHTLLLESFLNGSRTLILSGAGLSTESGLPDYRSPVGSYSKGHKPMTHQEFLRSALNRKRYWARSLVGIKYFSNVQPNSGHKAIYELEKMGLISGIVTQNVDRLHQASGCKDVLELHGNAYQVSCLNCETKFSRAEFSQKMSQMNKGWMSIHLDEPNQTDIRADGDAHLNTEDFDDFMVPSCQICSGTLMPTIVFFGGTVPSGIKDRSMRMVNDCDKLLIVGSSVTVWSSFRLCREAKQQGKQVAAINVGETRADTLLDLKIQARCGDVLSKVLPSLSH